MKEELLLNIGNMVDIVNGGFMAFISILMKKEQ